MFSADVQSQGVPDGTSCEHGQCPDLCLVRVKLHIAWLKTDRAFPKLRAVTKNVDAVWW